MISTALNQFFIFSGSTNKESVISTTTEHFALAECRIVDGLKYEINFKTDAILFVFDGTELKINKNNEIIKISSATLLAVSENTKLKIESMQKAGLFCLIGFHKNLLKKTAQIYSINLNEFLTPFKSGGPIPQKIWIQETIKRFHFALLTEKIDQNRAVDFLKYEIPKEIYYCHLWTTAPQHKDTFGIDQLEQQLLNPDLLTILEFIEKNIYEKITNDNLKKEFKIPHASLHRLFLKNLKISPAKYIRDRKLREAHDLLRKTSYNVTEVSHLLNFGQVSNFIFQFTKKFGEQPGKVIKRYRE